MLRPNALPWRRPRHELLLLALVAVATLSPVYVVSTQDVSRFCLTQALVQGRLQVDDCIGDTVDRAFHDGHSYSNKAPGMSILAIPAAEAVGLPDPSRWTFEGDLRLWAVRVLTSGIGFLLAAFLVGRVAEGLAPGGGGLTLVAFALGSIAGSFAASGFDHALAAGLGIAAFVLAWSRRPLLGGLAAGLALLVEYQAAFIVLAVGVYVAFLLGRRPLIRYVLGVLPGALLLGAYGWLAFGAPWRNPLRYSDNEYQDEHASGLLGIHSPSAHAVRLVLVGDRGLLVVSPVLAAAAAGLWLLWRRGYRAESTLCASVTGVFLIANSGYFAPYGGISPGPRFFVPALPFLTLGVGLAFARWRLPTTALAALSIVATTAVTLTWAGSEGMSYRQTVWGEIARFFAERGSSRLVEDLAKNVLVWGGPTRLVAAAVISCCAAAAFALAVGRNKADGQR